jgi:hypothetical protein
MATETDITINQGRTTVIVVTVSGVDSWESDYQTTLYAAKEAGGSILIEVDGEIDEVSSKITFRIEASDTVDLSEDTLKYEVVLYDSTGDYVKNVVYGLLYVQKTVKPNM